MYIYNICIYFIYIYIYIYIYIDIFKKSFFSTWLSLPKPTGTGTNLFRF